MHIFALADTVLGQTERFAATIVVASLSVPMRYVDGNCPATLPLSSDARVTSGQNQRRKSLYCNGLRRYSQSRIGHRRWPRPRP